MNKCLVTVIVPVYNAEQYLAECIESVIDQTVQDWQLILVDDGSTDASPDICKEYALKDTRITYLKQENQGVSVARNNGLKHADSEWVTFLDSDDCFAPFALEILLNKKPNTLFLMGGLTKNSISKCICSTKQSVVTNKEIKISILDFRKFNKRHKSIRSLSCFNNWSSCCRFFNLSIIKNHNIEYTKGIKLGEDLLFCLNYCNYIDYAEINESIIYYYRTNPVSASMVFRPDRITNTVRLITEIKESSSIKDLDKEFNRFVVNRILNCCFEYYSNPQCTLDEQEKIEDLKKLCSLPIIKQSIKSCSYMGLSPGTRTSLIMAVMLYFMKREKYKKVLAIKKL